MNNLFSVFDPSTSRILNLNWISSLLIVVVSPSIFWSRPATPSLLFGQVTEFLKSEFNAILGRASAPGLSLLPISLFLFIALNNFFGLFPFIFTSSSHLTFTVALALPLWVGHMAIGWAKTPEAILAHLVPLGTPPALIPFMVLIELVRRLIRPLTLAVRLAANMVAGHLLLTLLGNQAPGASVGIILTVILTLVLLATLETAVALIQAYVFSVLRTLYFNEVNSSQLS